METDKCCPEDNDLRVAVACLELEISDSVMHDLLTSLTGRLEDTSNSPAATLLLQSMDSVARHIDTLRVKSDLGAFNLMDQLWTVYVEITTELSAEKGLPLAIEQNCNVLKWQHNCLLNAQNKVASTAKPSSHSVARLIEEQISETSSFIRKEIASIKSITGATASSSAQSELVSAFMSDQLNDLQALFQQEIQKLRLEIHPDTE